MRLERGSGVFLHPTSLPGTDGIGDLGEGARAFVDFLDRGGATLWQICPLGPVTGTFGYSPYQSPSAFAGNPLLIDLSELVERGFLDAADGPDGSPHEVEYDAVSAFKRERLRTAATRFDERATPAQREEFAAFREREAAWLEDYALFMTLEEEFDGRAWFEWPADVRAREPDVLDHYREDLAAAVRYHAFVQWIFDDQWRSLREYATDRGVRIMGDLPLYVALDSADVWSTPEAFQLTDDHDPAAVAGVPPNPGDDGQRWGNPVYDWDALRETGYRWWLDRIDRLFDLVDLARIDHFKGFGEYWAIPADADDPAAGEWQDGPGADFFETVAEERGELPFVAEDLGFLDDGVRRLRDRFEFPGMRVPHYADWCQEGNRHQPMHYPRDCVAYTSTHDTDTAVGYYRDLSDEQRDCLHYNLGTDGEEIDGDILEAVWHSDAALTITTVPDLLGLGSEARFNRPGTARGNWRWRVTREGLDDGVADRLRRITDVAIR
jgi:4-alpha-glucanotransferase